MAKDKVPKENENSPCWPTLLANSPSAARGTLAVEFAAVFLARASVEAGVGVAGLLQHLVVRPGCEAGNGSGWRQGSSG